MTIFYIAGRNNCLEFAHAVHVAEILVKYLPDFRYKTIQKADGEWEAFLECCNHEHSWHFRKSPLIWKEITRMGGKPYPIGGLSQFWEYCYDYYGFECLLSKSEKQKIVADNQFIQSKFIEKKVFKHISIIGAFNPITNFLIMELQNYVDSAKHEEVVIMLYDENVDDPDDQEKFLAIIEEIKETVKCHPNNLKVVTTLTDCLKKCDMLFIIKNYARNVDEKEADWLRRCMSEMLYLSEEINMHAKRTLRIVLCHEGPVCFTASALVSYCTTIRLANIVAVTADEGISTIDFIAKKHELSVSQMCCPPVWGFSGYKSFVDISSAVIKCPVYRPFTRASKVSETSTLPKGRIKYELRLLSYLIEDEDKCLASMAERKKKEVALLNREPILPRVRAISSLLKLWLSENITDDIISLGVCSNGSFDFPSGVVMSQPVILNEKYIWEPFSNFPVSEPTKMRLEELVGDITNVLEKYDLGYKYNVDDHL